MSALSAGESFVPMASVSVVSVSRDGLLVVVSRDRAVVLGIWDEGRKGE